jgi:hypothetical protein
MSSEWRPISTAPLKRIGEAPEYVLLYGPGISTCTGRVARYGDGYLFAGVSHVAGNLADSGDATHWMPLPPPPAGTAHVRRPTPDYSERDE